MLSHVHVCQNGIDTNSSVNGICPGLFQSDISNNLLVLMSNHIEGTDRTYVCMLICCVACAVYVLFCASLCFAVLYCDVMHCVCAHAYVIALV